MRLCLIVFLGLFLASTAMADSTAVLIPGDKDTKTAFGKSVAGGKPATVKIETAKNEKGQEYKTISVEFTLKDGTLFSLKSQTHKVPMPSDVEGCSSTYMMPWVEKDGLQFNALYQERIHTPDCEKQNLENKVGVQSDLMLSVAEQQTGFLGWGKPTNVIGYTGFKELQ